MIVYGTWVRLIMRCDNVDFESGFQRDGRRGLGGCEEFILRCLEQCGELVCAVGETGTGVPGENDELGYQWKYCMEFGAALTGIVVV